MQINVKEIGLYFYPTNGEKCDIELEVQGDDKIFLWRWSRKNVTFANAKQIYDSSMNKSLCLINCRNKNAAVSSFCTTKTKIWPEIKPKTNFEEYEEFLKCRKKLIEIEKKMSKTENDVWKKTPKKKPTDHYEIGKREILEFIEAEKESRYIEEQKEVNEVYKEFMHKLNDPNNLPF